jgi:hypothetical protein
MNKRSDGKPFKPDIIDRSGLFLKEQKKSMRTIKTIV